MTDTPATTARPKAICPICHDPKPFVFWLDEAPPPTCPDDPAWPERSMNSICERQLRVARQAAERRRLVPDAFDENGNILPGQIGRVLQIWQAAHPEERLAI